jgi:cytoskeletal protein CcmA (bactofilin family)
MFGRKRFKANKLPKISTVIGKGTEIHGDVRFEGGLHVDGRVVGAILAEHDDKNTLVLSEIGYIEGDVRVPNVVLNGEVHGDVHASNRVDLASRARVHGTVYYKYLEMMIGAVVNGQLIRSDEQRNPLAGRKDLEGEQSSVSLSSVGEKPGPVNQPEQTPLFSSSAQTGHDDPHSCTPSDS